MYRFMYGFRSVTPFVLGIGPIPANRFILLNIIAVSTWAVLIGILGYLFGNVLQAVLGDLKKYELEILVAIVALGFCIWLILFFGRRRSKPS